MRELVPPKQQETIGQRIIFTSYLLAQQDPELQEGLAKLLHMAHPSLRLFGATSTQLATSVTALYTTGLHGEPETIY